MLSDGRTGADGEGAFDSPGYLADVLLRLGVKRQDFLCPLVQDFARRGQVDGIAGTVEQAGLVELLHGLHLEAHCRLGQMDELGGLGKAFGLRDSAENS